MWIMNIQNVYMLSETLCIIFILVGNKDKIVYHMSIVYGAM
jgi:hypothetical protein